jgi:4-hydroxybenzoate polyprenyltransferase
VALYIETLNATIDIENARTVAIAYARVPDTVLLLLFLGEILTMGVVGYTAGLQGSRGLLTAVVLVIVLGAILTLLVDLDRPRDGFLQVSQQPLIDLAEQIGS